MSETYPMQVRAKEAVELPISRGSLRLPGGKHVYEAAMQMKDDPSVYLLRTVPSGKDWLKVLRLRVDPDTILLYDPRW